MANIHVIIDLLFGSHLNFLHLFICLAIILNFFTLIFRGVMVRILYLTLLHRICLEWHNTPEMTYACIILASLLVFEIHITKNPPKPFGFISIRLNSALGELAVITGANALSNSIILKSAFLFAGGIFLKIYGNNLSFIPADAFMSLMEQIIRKTVELYRELQPILENPDPNHEFLTGVHAYITPYIRSYETLFRLILRIVLIISRNNPAYVAHLQDLEAAYREAGNLLLDAYRHIEIILMISIGDSPIPLQSCED